MTTVLIAFTFIILASTADDAMQGDEGYIAAVNISFLSEYSTKNCTKFQGEIESTSTLYTTLRFPVAENVGASLNVTLIGQNLSCGHNLYIMPLTLPQTKYWTGIWRSCPLMSSFAEGKIEKCMFNCTCLGGCAEIQVCKRPRKVEENYWSLCFIEFLHQLPGVILVDGCDDVLATRSGIYRLKLEFGNFKDVFCDADIDTGGWTVLLRREDGSENFDRDWHDYRFGFGSLNGEFWAGNEFIHGLTTGGRNYSLRVDLESYEDEHIFAVYDSFAIGPESENYKLHISGYSPNISTAEDSLSSHNRMMFTTKDHDNDLYKDNCAKLYGASWWFFKCHTSLLTGNYGQRLSYARGITWRHPWGYYKFARFATMMIRPN